MVASGGRNNARRGNRASKQIGEGATSLEGTRMLEQFQFEDELRWLEPEVGAFSFDDGSPPNVRTDEFVGGGDAVPGDLSARHGD